MSQVLERLLDRLPEAIFDLIARMLPGGILVVMIAPSVHAPGLFIPSRGDTVGILVFLVFAYSAGLAVSALSWVLSSIGWLFVFLMLRGPGTETLIEAAARHHLGLRPLDWDPRVAMDVFARVHDYVKAHAPNERSLAIKLHAEVTLLYSLTAIFLVAWLAYENGQGETYFVALALFVAGVIRSFRTWQRHASILLALPPEGP